jgi:hypothetical protein
MVNNCRYLVVIFYGPTANTAGKLLSRQAALLPFAPLREQEGERAIPS